MGACIFLVKMKKHIFLFFYISLAAVVIGCRAPQRIVLKDDFSAPTLNSSLWEITKKGDFNAWDVGLVEGKKGGRVLRVRADTMGTRDDTVKFIGIKSKMPIDISTATISFGLDWNNQANGSYLTAGLYLVPEKTVESQKDLKDWLAVQYVGVPPGKNARCEVLENTNGRMSVLFWEGWPENKQGRPISYQRVKVVFSGETLRIEENDRIIFETDSYRSRFDQAYLYFQMSSHSNYPSREVYFDNLSVSYPGNK